jgi:endonuclease/exonuclease/phosphatase family metal-dependent hydrolase
MSRYAHGPVHDFIMQLAVMTYNIRHARGLDDRVDLSRVADVLRQANADIICLQEIDSGLPRSSFQKQSELLGQSLNFQHCSHENFGVLGHGMGNAIISRYPIYSTWNEKLPFAGEPRGLLCSKIILPCGPVLVTCTHWGLSQTQRRKQSDKCSRTLSNYEMPKVFCGDLNAVVASEEVSNLLSTANLQDCGPTDGNSFSSALPVVKIDYVLISQEFKGLSAVIVTSDASDHFPVLVTLEVPDSAPIKPSS